VPTAEDYVDAFEKLLRLGLSGKQACINIHEDELFCMYTAILFIYAFSSVEYAGSRNHKGHC